MQTPHHASRWYRYLDDSFTDVWQYNWTRLARWHNYAVLGEAHWLIGIAVQDEFFYLMLIIGLASHLSRVFKVFGNVLNCSCSLMWLPRSCFLWCLSFWLWCSEVFLVPVVTLIINCVRGFSFLPSEIVSVFVSGATVLLGRFGEEILSSSCTPFVTLVSYWGPGKRISLRKKYVNSHSFSRYSPPSYDSEGCKSPGGWFVFVAWMNYENQNQWSGAPSDGLTSRTTLRNQTCGLRHDLRVPRLPKLDGVDQSERKGPL